MSSFSGNAFSMDREPEEPRIAFWGNPESWPRDTDDYEFLGRVVLRAGREMPEARWKDKDPAVSFKVPLLPTFNRYTPSNDIDRAIAILSTLHPTFGQRYAETHCYPTSDEWDFAFRKDQERFKVDRDAMTRFFTVTGRLTAAFSRGTIGTAERDFWGGEIKPLPAYVWNGEHIQWRFDNCRFDPMMPHRPPGPFTGEGRWIFVERKSLHAAPPAVPAEPEEVEIAKAAAEASRSGKAKAGRKRSSAWDDMMGALMKMYRDEGMPLDPNYTEIATKLCDWAIEQGHDSVPEIKTVAASVARWISQVRGT